MLVNEEELAAMNVMIEALLSAPVLALSNLTGHKTLGIEA